MKRILCVICAAALLLSPANLFLARAADWSASSQFSSLPDLPGSGQDRSTRYSTAAMDTYNSADLEITGTTLLVKRRARKSHDYPDQVRIKQSGVVRLERSADWAPLPLEAGYSGYDLTVDLASLPAGVYTVEIDSRELYIYTLLSTELTRDATGAYFSRNNTTSKQYNNGLLQRLNSGDVPDDFTALKEMYGKDEAGSAILAEISETARAATAGRASTLDKVMAINEWLVQNIAYDADVSGDSYYSWVEANPGDAIRLDNPLNAFREGYALCYGYSRLAVLMLGYAGVNSVYVTGRLANEPGENINNKIGGADTLETMNHAWNAVKIGSSWYFIDTSQDALNYYRRTNKASAVTGYIEANRAPIYVYTFPSLNQLSKTHIALRLGVKNAGTKLSATPIPDGWQKSGENTRSFYTDGVQARSAWQKIDGQIYYFNAGGNAVKGWQRVENYWRYFDEDGALVTGTHIIKEGDTSESYRFDEDGCITASDGWITFKGATRYYEGREMLTGWQYLRGNWYYFNSSGALYQDADKPLILSDGEFRFNEDGQLQMQESGWVVFGGEQRYFDDGKMRTGLQLIDGENYFLDPTGVMQTGWQTVGGKLYYFDEDGVMQTGWLFLEESWYYVDKAEGRYTGTKTVGGSQHYFDSQGRLSTGGWVNLGDGYLYFAGAKESKGVSKGGRMHTGWRTVDGSLRFFDRTDGRMYTGADALYNENNKKWYTFDQDGKATAKS